jgi:hypothetical protein
MKKDNLQPSSENDIKVSEKVQRLTGEESTNKPDTNIPHLIEQLKCSMCNKFKPVTDFSKSKTIKRGYDYRCKECNRERAMKYHEDNKIRILAKWKKRRIKLTCEERAIIDDKNRKWYEQTIKQRILYRAKDRAKKSNIPFNITEDDIVLPELCPLLNIPFEYGSAKSKWYTYSLDRIYPEKGYVKGNVQVITYLANTMKSSASKEELITFATNILKLFKDDDIV